jgi:uncharacterized protein YndB with AHSA1/START domain
MRILFYSVASLIALVGVIALVGLLLPREHSASGERRITAPSEAVFALITDPGGYPRWRRDVKAVELLSAAPLRFRERGGNGDILFEEVERLLPTHLVIRIADDNLPFGGQWTYSIRPDGGGSILAIREDGFVKNPLFRFLARYVFGHTATLNGYLDAVAARFTSTTG